MYSETVMVHFMCPQNVGSMPDADGEGTVEKQHCSNLGVGALRKAIYNYREKQGITGSRSDNEVSAKSYFNVKTIRI